MAIPIIEIGKYNTLEVLKRTDFGIYVGDEVEEVLMPTKWVPEGTEVGDMIEVFIYADSSDRMIATTMTPKVVRDEFAHLRVSQTSSIGAFLDWGLEKDLLVPFKEQVVRMEAGKSYTIYMYLDEVTDRLVASSHLNKFLEHEQIDLEEGEEVELLISNDTELGFQAIINNKYKGLIYKNEIFGSVQPGDRIQGYVKRIREDKKIDLSLQKIGAASIEPNAEIIYQKLKDNGGVLNLHDKSAPEEIYDTLKMSKKNFKKAIGSLFKQKLILIGEEGIEIIKKSQK
ncbi:S1 RNA-binding domain-containing protein [Marinoscillum sp. MHG1-6]|uniref:CvfB family protein n=1 Tax=Marinoscillum sp. MHG1-6 TaxID=2959627 RepID=UPI0021588E6B|nr:S1-like domain-containing RNA-binding protein [Marinoscillum sp. MHG1-6]